MFTVVINAETVLEYRPQQRLPGQVRRLLEAMDNDMSVDLPLAGELIENPDTLQRARFVGMKLIQAIAADNKGLQAATCAWLGSRLPSLKSIDAREADGEVNMQLIME